ncbi:uncharacterized protein LOC113523686 [Pangasianodon hypophthalmus]|uniref:uncharacterized protein LOC113523686 n=1 Tax=Pangasianodon hypophthalmus TaxID=310915 RepID=UPI002307480D|nr:uncharacterized protein LOC113523686 [Pangasianodon hypophthalmus]
MKLLALVLLLSAFSSLTLTEVEDSLSSFKERCHDFFIPNPKNKNDVIVPTIFKGHQYKKICQRWKNKYRFATVYDTEKRIPVYSAYTFLQKENTTRRNRWKIEPQLENVKEYEEKKEMMDSPKKAGNIINQAVSSDYTNSSYTRGHVFPCSFAADQDQADSTFTLTNIAPQTRKSNNKWASQVEEPMLTEINENCRLDQNHLAYIVTGVVPGKKWIPITRNKKYKKGINIPSYFWSTFCCTSKNNIKKLISRAYIAHQLNFKLRCMTIAKLNKQLTKFYKKGTDFKVIRGRSSNDRPRIREKDYVLLLSSVSRADSDLPQSPQYEELLEVVSQTVAKLSIDWPAETRVEPQGSKLGERFLRSKPPPPRRSLPFFPDLHTEVSRSWRRPFSAR